MIKLRDELEKEVEEVISVLTPREKETLLEYCERLLNGDVESKVSRPE